MCATVGTKHGMVLVVTRAPAIVCTESVLRTRTMILAIALAGMGGLVNFVMKHCAIPPVRPIRTALMVVGVNGTASANLSLTWWCPQALANVDVTEYVNTDIVTLNWKYVFAREITTDQIAMQPIVRTHALDMENVIPTQTLASAIPIGKRRIVVFPLVNRVVIIMDNVWKLLLTKAIVFVKITTNQDHIVKLVRN